MSHRCPLISAHPSHLINYHMMYVMQHATREHSCTMQFGDLPIDQDPKGSPTIATPIRGEKEKRERKREEGLRRCTRSQGEGELLCRGQRRGESKSKDDSASLKALWGTGLNEAL
eukprot:824750-Pelagomonas_calceolata.AAC.5